MFVSTVVMSRKVVRIGNSVVVVNWTSVVSTVD